MSSATFDVPSFASRFPLRWICYLAYFVGVSFQSGGIVHYSIDPGRYGKLVVIGAIVFIFGAIGSDLIDKDSLLRSSGPIGFATFIVSSLILSIGVGMIGGSVQHFLDIPTRAPYLIGFGLILSALGFHGRFRPHNNATELIASVAVVAVLALPVVAVLHSYAKTLPEATNEQHPHGEDAKVSTSTTPTVVAPETSNSRTTVPASTPGGDPSQEVSTTIEGDTPETTPGTTPASTDGHLNHKH